MESARTDNTQKKAVQTYLPCAGRTADPSFELLFEPGWTVSIRIIFEASYTTVLDLLVEPFFVRLLVARLAIPAAEDLGKSCTRWQSRLTYLSQKCQAA